MDIISERDYDIDKDERKFRSNLATTIFTSPLDLAKNGKVGTLTSGEMCVFLPNYQNPGQRFVCSVIKKTAISGGIFRNLTKKQVDRVIQKIKQKTEVKKEIFLQSFYYNTKKFIIRASKSKDVKKFTKKYQYKLLDKCSKKRILELFNLWCDNLKKRGKFCPPKDEMLFFLSKKNIEKYDIQFLFLEVDKKLVGLKIVFPFIKGSKKLLVLRHQFSDNSYYGIGQFLTLEVAKKFKNYKEFTDGGEFTKPNFDGRRSYKLNKRKPERIEDIYSLSL